MPSNQQPKRRSGEDIVLQAFSRLRRDEIHRRMDAMKQRLEELEARNDALESKIEMRKNQIQSLKDVFLDLACENAVDREQVFRLIGKRRRPNASDGDPKRAKKE